MPLTISVKYGLTVLADITFNFYGSTNIENLEATPVSTQFEKVALST